MLSKAKITAAIAPYLIVACVILGCNSAPLERLNTSKQAVTPLKTVNVTIKQNCEITAQSQRIDFFAASQSYFIDVRNLEGVDYHVLIADSDGDGVRDSDETQYSQERCLNAKKADSMVDNYGDWIVNHLKLSCDQQGMLQSFASGDADGDLLSDADESLLETDASKWDTDGDGIPDGLEARAGMNPMVKNTGSWVGDNRLDMEKIRLGLPFDRTITSDIERYAFRYNSAVSSSDAGLCYEDTIENIPVLPAIGSNQLLFFKVSARNQEQVLEVRQLRVPSELADGASISTRWEDLEVRH